MGLFMLMLDSTVVTLALPAIRRELGASPSELQWVVNAYLLTVAVFVVTAGRLGDMVGRKRVFLVALAIFSGGLVVAALAPSIEVLVVARVIQGVGAAGMLTLSLALVSSAFSDDERPRALGIWAGVSAVALAIGPLVGGVLVDQLSWRWVFWIGVPPLALGFLWTARATRETRDENAGRHLDVPGVIALTLGLGLIVLALVQGDDWGWSSARTLVVLALGIVSAIAFVVIDEHVKRPVVEFALFRNRPYLGATAAQAFAITRETIPGACGPIPLHHHRLACRSRPPRTRRTVDLRFVLFIRSCLPHRRCSWHFVAVCSVVTTRSRLCICVCYDF